jgi:hypothetical protein
MVNFHLFLFFVIFITKLENDNEIVIIHEQ